MLQDVETRDSANNFPLELKAMTCMVPLVCTHWLTKDTYTLHGLH